MTEPDSSRADCEELAARIEAHYRQVARTGMADVPICNPRLAVRLVRMEAWEGVRVAALVMPWAINLLLLPGQAPWPAGAPLSKRVWNFPSGDYAFIHGEDVGFGPYQVCSLFSPALEFDSQEAACETALAALLALLRPPLEVAQAVPVSRRSWLLGRAP